MCLIFLALQQHSDYPVIILANRDEAHQRPSKAAHFWPEAPQVLAGKDLEKHGTWLGINATGRFAAITNFRNGQPAPQPKSRGVLTTNYLLNQVSQQETADLIIDEGDQYGGFNLLLGDLINARFSYYHNHSNYQSHSDKPAKETIDSGMHGLSNGQLNSNWPKVTQGIKELETLLTPQKLEPPDFITWLRDERKADDEQLPSTGIPLDIERQLSSRFIRGSDYGTRCSTCLLVDRNRQAVFWEQSYDSDGNEEALKKFTLQL